MHSLGLLRGLNKIGLLKCREVARSAQSMVVSIINLPIKENTELYLFLEMESNVIYE